ncbi:alpha/beta-hydrolase [Gyrodon lividus]|nr:alpha/beta-hydrolase [Gyrodon lividus]
MSTIVTISSTGWRVELERDWDVLGPFPTHAREQHFLSPAYPLDLSSPILTTTQPSIYPTSLTHTAYASWSRTTADLHGTIVVSHPSVPWEQIRATEGWAGIQHMNVVRGWLSVHPPSRREEGRDTGDGSVDESEPLLRADLLQGAFFTILPPPDSPQRKTNYVPEWHPGNVYAMERAPAQFIRFPVSPARNGKGTRYEVIICGAYEIRLFGDPNVYSSPYPILTLNFSVALEFPCAPAPLFQTTRTQISVESSPIQHIPTHSITPHIVDGTPFGEAIGIGMRARLNPGLKPLPPSLSLALLDGMPIRIAPTQMRVIPLRLLISSFERIPEDVVELDVELTCETFILRTSLPLTHIPLWTETEHIPIRATYFFAGSMVTAFSVKPPRKAKRCRGNEPILALHGAGVDILTQSFWADSLMRQKYAWVVIPQGRTAWGLDWHGPSTADAFTAVSALSHILSTSGLGRWKEWGFDPGTRVVLMGHSNGGQGAWYMASRWPDRVCAVIPAAGYIKSQAYVSWCMSRFAHFVDPALRAVLDSSLTPDDNDLFLGNLVGMPVLAIHGGADDNVPPWHTREQVGTLKTWRSGADVTCVLLPFVYHEDPGQPHWYFDILFNKHVQIFLDRHVYTEAANSQEGETKSFTLTVAVPAESGSMDGWQICALNVPGLLARLQVVKPPNGHTSIRTTNISAFSLDLNIWFTVCGELVGLENTTTALTVDGEDIRVDVGGMGYSDSTILFMRDVKMYKPSAGLRCKPTWKPSQRLQAILSTHAPLTLLVPTLAPSPELSAALRIAHALQLFHSLDTQIVSVREVAEAGGDVGSGNLVVIGCAEESLVQGWLERMRSIWTYRDGAWRIDERKFERPSSAILFLQQHPYNLRAISLFLQSTDTSGLERAVRLFPIRTGVLSPDWLVVDGRADKIGAAAVEGAGYVLFIYVACGTRYSHFLYHLTSVYGWTLDDDQHTSTMPGKWIWNERMSWID